MAKADIDDAAPWEIIGFKPTGNDQPREIARIRVPGGWLVAASWGANYGPLTYVPDQDGTWNPRDDWRKR